MTLFLLFSLHKMTDKSWRKDIKDEKGDDVNEKKDVERFPLNQMKWGWMNLVKAQLWIEGENNPKVEPEKEYPKPDDVPDDKSHVQMKYTLQLWIRIKTRTKATGKMFLIFPQVALPLNYPPSLMFFSKSLIIKLVG